MPIVRCLEMRFHSNEISLAIVLCLSLLVIPLDSAFPPAEQLKLSSSSDGDGRSLSGVRISFGSAGKSDDDDKVRHRHQPKKVRERRDKQRKITSHQVVSIAESTSENVVQKTLRRHQGNMQQQKQQQHQQQLQGTGIGTRQQRDTASSSWNCSLLARNPDLPRLLRILSQEGETHLIEYSISFPEYPTNPLRGDWTTTSSPNATTTYVYQGAKWQRVLTSQGKALLTLAFNYNALSLGLLRYGVKKMTVSLVDSPPECFAKQNISRKMALTLNLLLRDFDEDGESVAGGGFDGWTYMENDLWKHASNFVCHQIVQDDGGFAKFSHKCCTTRYSSGRRRIVCTVSSTDDLFTFLNIILASLKIIFFFFGPLLLQKLLFSGSTGRSEYVVPLERDVRKTILIRRVSCEDGSSPAKRKEMRQFVMFRELVKSLKSEQVMHVTFRRLDILVDNRELMSEDEVPVGLLRFLLDAFVRCKISRVEPFRTCCAESVIGSWSPYFLWLRLKRHVSDCNRGCKEICAWASIFRCLGGLMLMAILPLPFYVRIVAFYWFEKEETEARDEASSQLGLRYRRVGIDLFQWLISDYSLIVAINVVFYVSYLLLSLMRAADVSKVDGVVLRSVTDMRKIRRKECLRMLCAHLVLPFEKFGLCGVLVGALYWPLALPLCLLVALVYCIPTLYLVGRLLLPSRPKCLRTRPVLSPPAELNPTNNSPPLLSEGVTSFSSCFLLERISVDRCRSVKGNTTTQATRRHRQSLCPSRQSVAMAIASALIALSIIVCMLAIMAMYSEAFGFLVEVGVFATLGAIVNAKYSICNVVLVFWSCVYVVVPYRAVYARYTELSRCVFRFLKAALGERIQSASLLRCEKQTNTAFKFLGAPAVVSGRSLNSHQNPRWPNGTDVCHEQDAPATTTTEAENRVFRTPVDQTPTTTDTDETIEYRDDRLHWKIRSLVMFVDRKDKPRIPRELFWRICELDLNGNPGPVRRAMAVATGYLFASLLFLLLLYVVVQMSAEMLPTSSVVQALVVLGVGSAPFVAFLVFIVRGQAKQRLNEYSLTGKIQSRILEQYQHAWPVQDLHFSHLEDIEESTYGDPDESSAKECLPHVTRGQTSGPRGRASYDPSQVDLLITIRDEDESRQGDEGPCSHTPSGSPCSDVFRNSSEDFAREGVPLRLLGNRAMRCTSDPSADSHQSNALVPELSCHDVTDELVPCRSYHDITNALVPGLSRHDGTTQTRDG